MFSLPLGEVGRGFLVYLSPPWGVGGGLVHHHDTEIDVVECTLQSADRLREDMLRYQILTHTALIEDSLCSCCVCCRSVVSKLTLADSGIAQIHEVSEADGVSVQEQLTNLLCYCIHTCCDGRAWNTERFRDIRTELVERKVRVLHGDTHPALLHHACLRVLCVTDARFATRTRIVFAMFLMELKKLKIKS